MRNTLYLFLIFILVFSVTSLPGVALENEYKITYLIDINENGDAIWNVEYRTILSSQNDFESFDNYSQQMEKVYLQEFKELMRNSTSEAAISTSRAMVAKDFTGNTEIQSTPTGTYGVVEYSFTWTNFASTGQNIIIGDVFFGGLYLSKDNTLIIKYPEGYEIDTVQPEPDVIRNGLIWYGLRSFGPNEPGVVLLGPSSSWKLYLSLLIIVSAGSYIIYRRKIRTGPETPGNDIVNLEDRIINLLKENDGTLYQSDLVRKLNLPRSTVSSALNELNNRNLIQKIKKGRENIIRITE